MYAAYVCAKRGHHVTVYEKQDHVGGQLYILSKIKGYEKYKIAYEFWYKECLRLGVEFKLSCEVTKEMIHSSLSDSIIWAGGDSIHLPNKNIVTPEDMILNPQSLGDNVLIVGAQSEGIACAKYLEGRNITMIDCVSSCSLDNVTYIPNAIIQKYTKDGLIYTQEGEKKKIGGFDSILVTTDRHGTNPMIKEIEKEIYVISHTPQVNKATEKAAEIAFKI